MMLRLAIVDVPADITEIEVSQGRSSRAAAVQPSTRMAAHRFHAVSGFRL
jgi:hypothetical protein